MRIYLLKTLFTLAAYMGLLAILMATTRYVWQNVREGYLRLQRWSVAVSLVRRLEIFVGMPNARKGQE